MQKCSTLIIALVLCVVGASVVNAATLTVTSSADAGAGSLRDTIGGAAAGDVIIFDSSVTTITLASVISIGIDLDINGPGAGSLTLDGNNTTAVFTVTAGVVSIRGMTITNANSTVGSGVNVTGGTVTVERCAFTNCTMTDAGFDGGTIRNAGGVLNVLDTTITNCNNTGSGGACGGIWLTSGGPATIERVEIAGCDSGRATAVGIAGTHGSAILRFCNISGNTSNDNRASIYSQTGTGHIMENCTVANNTAATTNGGPWLLSGTWTITNCTFDGNSGNDLQGTATVTISNSLIGLAAGSFTSAGYNIVSDVGSSTGWVGTDSTGTAGTPINLMLGTLGNNGGPTQTMLPQAGSPAIDFVAGAGPDLDQRGLIRTGTIDAGAAEVGASGPFSLTPNPVDLGGDITLTGEEMTQITAVTIGGVAGTLGTATATTLVVTLGAGTPVGPDQVVQVTAAAKNQSWLSVDVVSVAPAVSGVSPNPVAPGGTLTITGTNLGGTTSVTIAGVTAVVQTRTSTQVVVTVSAAQAVGTGLTVVVTTPVGTDSTATVDVATGGGSGGGGGGDDGGCSTGPTPGFNWLLLLGTLAGVVTIARTRTRRA